MQAFTSSRTKASIILRSGDKGGPTAADVMAFEEVLNEKAKPNVPHLRAPAFPSRHRGPLRCHRSQVPSLHRYRVQRWRAVASTNSKSSPASRNIARTAKVTVSNTYADGTNVNQQDATHLTDGTTPATRAVGSRRKKAAAGRSWSSRNRSASTALFGAATAAPAKANTSRIDSRLVTASKFFSWMANHGNPSPPTPTALADAHRKQHHIHPHTERCASRESRTGRHSHATANTPR